MDYQVAIEPFHGPLDLLLYLVRKHEVDILDIPIAQITEQFLNYLHIIETLDVEAAGDFLVMASTLMEIKSKLLLPVEKSEAQEEEADPRRELVRQLMEYRKIKDAASQLEARAEKQQTRIARDPIEEPLPSTKLQPLRELELWDLVNAFGRLMRETAALQPRNIIVDETPQHVYEQYIERRLQDEGSLSFRSIFTAPYHRVRLVGLFLAILELVKRSVIKLEQPTPFAEIQLYLTSEEGDPPEMNQQ